MRRLGERWRNQIANWLTALGVMLVTPNTRQKEAYARYCHTLSAAAAIGSLTLAFTESSMGSVALRSLTLLVTGVLLFIFGVLVLREE